MKNKHPKQKRLLVRIGGSNRKLSNQLNAFELLGFDIDQVGHTSGHHSNRQVLIPNTEKARALLESVGGTIARKQWGWLENE
jgi:hypothetical protein